MTALTGTDKLFLEAITLLQEEVKALMKLIDTQQEQFNTLISVDGLNDKNLPRHIEDYLEENLKVHVKIENPDKELSYMKTGNRDVSVALTLKGQEIDYSKVPLPGKY